MKLLVVTIFFIVDTPISCLDGIISSLAPIAPVIKPIGKGVSVVLSSMTPILEVVKKIPSWGKTAKNLKKDVKETNLDKTTLFEKPTAKANNEIEVPDIIPNVKDQKIEIVPAAAPPAILVPVAVIQPQIGGQQPASQAVNAPPPPLPVVMPNLALNTAIEALIEEVNTADLKNSKGRFRRKIYQALATVRNLLQNENDKLSKVTEITTTLTSLQQNRDNENKRQGLLDVIAELTN